MSIVNWDQLADSDVFLSEKQLESIFLLTSRDWKPALDVGKSDAGVDKIACPSTSSSPESKPLMDTPGDTDDSSVVHIQQAAHFYSWLESIEREINTTNSDNVTRFLEYLAEKKGCCSKILSDLRYTLSDLSTLGEHYLSVSKRTNSLHDVCEHLLQKQNELSETTSKIEGILTYFTNIDAVEAELRTSNFVVSREKMKSILDRLDASIHFLRKHSEFKETETYMARAKDALMKALNLIKDNVTRLIDRTINELLDLHDVVNPDNSFILLYGRFRSQGPKIRSVISLIEERVDKSPEYMQVLNEAHNFYLLRREELLAPVARNGVEDLVGKYPNDHCALLRTGGAFMVHMCEDETRLFSQFFMTQYSAALTEMLSRLCRCLYDVFRPFIIRTNHMEILAELCDILKYELTEEYIVNSQLDMTAFAELCATLLADVQERLIFRSHIYIKSQILGYDPSPGDLSYPEKLEMMNDIARATAAQKAEDSAKNSKEQNSESLPSTETADASPTESTPDWKVRPGANMSLSPADLHGMWYPTVRRALVCLSKLSRCLDPESFRGLAQECVSMCVLSLVKASEAITIRRTPADGQLFLIKHLLILREQTAPFNVEFSVKETSLDFSNLKDAAKGIWGQGGPRRFAINLSQALLRFLLETPNVVEIEIDSRRQLDGQLKQTCELFISQTVEQLSGDIPTFLERAKSVLAAPGARLSDQPFANASAVKEIVSSAHRQICLLLGRTTKGSTAGKSSGGANLIHSLHTYLANPDTESILLRHIQSGLLVHWRALYQIVQAEYSDEDRMIIACPTESQIRLLFQDI
ncbi:unnamed protein product [Calicophoron daubneyi]|uniref:Conserved oligomeric Golgi complex subunit 3 n=1 Tax=Calicophoron daubneyi TaxID=300641 RepID=A0AAV2T6L4_CALDB